MKTFYFILETDIIILFNNTIAINDDFMNLSDDEKFIFLFSNDNSYIYIYIFCFTAKICYEMYILMICCCCCCCFCFVFINVQSLLFYIQSDSCILYGCIFIV